MWFLDQIDGGWIAVVACHIGLFMTSSIERLSKVCVSLLLYCCMICVLATLDDGSRRDNA